MTDQSDNANIYTRSKMSTIITIPASELTTDFDKNLLIKLRNEFEGKCNENGYIEKGSIEIIDHDTLNTEVIRFSGSVRVKVYYTGKVVNPIKGDIIECKIKRFNQFGLMAYVGPLNIVIPFDNDNKLNDFKEGQNLKVKIVDSEIILNDNQMSVYATFYDSKNEIKNVKNIKSVEEIMNEPKKVIEIDEEDSYDSGEDIDNIESDEEEPIIDKVDEDDEVENDNAVYEDGLPVEESEDSDDSDGSDDSDEEEDDVDNEKE